MTVDENTTKLISTIVVGDMAQWTARQKDIPVIDGIAFHSAEDIILGRVDIHKVQIILSPLITQGRDALEIASCLQDQGFRGMYRVVADEVRGLAPDLDFDILDI